MRPYVTLNGDVARADPGRLVQERERLLSGWIRKVDDPVEVKRKSLEVCNLIHKLLSCL